MRLKKALTLNKEILKTLVADQSREVMGGDECDVDCIEPEDTQPETHCECPPEL